MPSILIPCCVSYAGLRRATLLGLDDVVERTAWVRETQLGCQSVVANPPAKGGGGATGTCCHHHPGRFGVGFFRQLGEGAFGDVVISAPVGGNGGVGKLITEMAVFFFG